MRIFGEWHAVRATIATIDGFSAHADLDGLLDWYGSLGGKPRCTYVVHGEEKAALSFGETLGERFGARVEVPHPGQSFALD